MPPSFKLTHKQELANRLLASDATHCMLYGGSRSGKTFGLVRALTTRALARPSRHAILRFRFNHIKASIVYDTFPKVVDLCFPGVPYKLDKSDWFALLPNGSEIWFGGLDDKERTEKILGQEYSTIYLNECSQIPWVARNMAVTRLAQKIDGMRLKMYYDCNPPSQAHWTYQVFANRVDPISKQPLPAPDRYGWLQMNPEDNRENLPESYLQELESLPARERARFLLGQFGDATEGALWSIELCDQQRTEEELPSMVRIVVAVDPSGGADEDATHDEVGIVVCGLGQDGHGYVLEDCTLRGGPAKWGRAVVDAYDRWRADRVVAETNFGGAMVGHVIKATTGDAGQPRSDVAFKAVTSTRGKVVRAEPVATLFEAGKVYLAGRYSRLEEEMCAMSTTGYKGTGSPNRVDAMVFGMTELFPMITRKQQERTAPPQVIYGRGNMSRRGNAPRVLMGRG